MSTVDHRPLCSPCHGTGEIGFRDPVTGLRVSMLCPSCTPPDVDLDPQVDDHECTDPTCSDPDHLPDRDEDAAWLWDDDRQRRRADV